MEKQLLFTARILPLEDYEEFGYRGTRIGLFDGYTECCLPFNIWFCSEVADETEYDTERDMYRPSRRHRGDVGPDDLYETAVNLRVAEWLCDVINQNTKRLLTEEENTHDKDTRHHGDDSDALR